jgi:hypothetical protein
MGLMALAAMTAMMLIGAGTASAEGSNYICNATSLAECTPKTSYAKGTELSATLKTGTKFIIKGELPVTCTTSSIKATLGENPTEEKAVSAEVTSFTLGNCTMAGVACTYEAGALPYNAQVEPGKVAGNGTESVGPGSSGLRPRFTFNCPLLGYHCEFAASETGPGGASDSMNLQVENGGEVKLNGIKMVGLINKGTCGESQEWTAEYKITNGPAWITHYTPPTVLCSANQTPCAAKSVYPKGTALKAQLEAGSAFQLSGEVPVKCTESSITTSTSAESGLPLAASVSGMSFGGCKLFGFNCTDAAVNLPYGAAIERTSGGNGNLTLSSGGSGAPAFTVLCPLLAVECKFSVSGVQFGVQGGNPAKLTATAVKLQSEINKAMCGETATLSATYSVSSPAPLFVTRL